MTFARLFLEQPSFLVQLDIKHVPHNYTVHKILPTANPTAVLLDSIPDSVRGPVMSKIEQLIKEPGSPTSDPPRVPSTANSWPDDDSLLSQTYTDHTRTGY